MTEQKNLWIGTSWKMHKTLSEAQAFASVLANVDSGADRRIQQFVVPPFTVARDVVNALSHTSVKVGAQNMHWAEQGAWTGEISPLMLTDCGLDLVELGHSERREHFGETDETVGLKVEAAIRHGLIPLICIGETLTQKDAGQATAILAKQVKAALGNLNAVQKSAPLLFAYEPVWAIGENGVPASSAYANDRQAEIVELAQDILDQSVPCLYGGSVNPDNCAELITRPNIDGLFIGRSAWNADGYLNILARASAALQFTKETIS